jgi:VCBS repeat-containing protein
VNAVNDAPVAVDDTATTDEDVALTLSQADLKGNDTDVDNTNAQLSVTAVSNPSNGTAVLNGDGTVTFTPALNFFGTAGFDYTLSDGSLTDTGHVTVTVNAVNDAPVATNDSYSTDEDIPLTVPAPGVLGNDTDVDSATLTAVKVSEPAHGTLTLSANGSFTYTPAANYNGADSFTYKANDGGLDSNVATVYITVNAVNDVPSSVTVSPSVASISENGSTTVSGSFTDPDVGQAHTVTIDWGDGSTPTSIPLAAGTFTFSSSHQYLDDSPTATSSDVKTVSVTVSDGTASANASTSVTVNNAAPVITAVTGPINPISKGGSASVSATFTDVGTLDPHTCTFAWDDNTASATASATGTGNGSCSATHTYNATGVYIVQVTVADDDSGSATTAFQYVVIYDPNGGFVTGGGWIDSPAGACKLAACTDDTTGKANFGFVSKYAKGNTPVVDGETEFQFKAGNLNFHSTSYSDGSLVISGPMAQYKGTGTINGSGAYNFTLTARDGQVSGGGGTDGFRIKITNASGGGVVYDNRAGANDTLISTNTQALGGGSVTIHSK